MSLIPNLMRKLVTDLMKSRLTKASGEERICRLTRYLSQSRLRYLVQLPPYLVGYHVWASTGPRFERMLGAGSWSVALMTISSIGAACIAIVIVHVPFAILYHQNRQQAKADKQISSALYDAAQRIKSETAKPPNIIKQEQVFTELNKALRRLSASDEVYLVTPNAVYLTAEQFSPKILSPTQSSVSTRLLDIIRASREFRQALEGCKAHVTFVLPDPTDPTVQESLARRAKIVSVSKGVLQEMNRKAIRLVRDIAGNREAGRTVVCLSRRLPSCRFLLAGDTCYLQEIPDDSAGILEPVRQIAEASHPLGYSTIRVGLCSLAAINDPR